MDIPHAGENEAFISADEIRFAGEVADSGDGVVFELNPASGDSFGRDELSFNQHRILQDHFCVLDFDSIR